VGQTFRVRCVTCGSEFEAVRKQARFCRRECQLFERRCADCGQAFTSRSPRRRRCDECAAPRRRFPGSGTQVFAAVKSRPGPSRTKKILRDARKHRRAEIDMALRSRTDRVVRAYRKRQVA